MFHQHRWVTTGVHFNEPGPVGTAEGVSVADGLQLFYGFTNITQKCTRCGRVVTDVQPGKVDESAATWTPS